MSEFEIWMENYIQFRLHLGLFGIGFVIGTVIFALVKEWFTNHF